MYKPGTELLFNINGKRSANINVTNTKIADAKLLAEYNQEATKKALKVK